MKLNLSKRQKIITIIWGAVSALLIALLIWGNVFAASFDQILSSYFGRTGEGSSGLGEKTYVSDYKTKDDALAAFSDLNKEIIKEGTVLMYNNGGLPLDKSSEKLSVFGMSSALWMTLDRIPQTKNAVFANSLEDYGFSVNGELRKFYNTSKHTKWGQGDPKGNGDGEGDWKIDEVPQSEYTDAVKNSYKNFNDAAIIVLSRGSGEGADLPRSMDRFGGDADRHYLQLTKEEDELFEAVGKAGFKKTIVILHSAGAFQMDFIKKYKVDAVLWTAGTGVDGIKSLAPILAGDYNPSGRLVDTYSYDNYSSPAMQNFGDSRFVDESGKLTGYSYVNYAEGVYVGYKYYETRYEDVVMGKGNAGAFNYDEVVAAPFGFGLSYTTFDWSDYKCEYDSVSDSFKISVKVTNTGDKPGKDVVQIYSQSEYTAYDVANGIEKPAVNLCGFAKTGELAKNGGSETVEITVPRYELAVYDAKGAGTYILDAGNHYLTAATDAHAAVNNLLKAKGFNVQGDADMVKNFNYETTDDETYAGDVKNKFDNASLNDAVYLSRNDWSAMDGKGINWVNLENSKLSYATQVKEGISNTTNKAKTVNVAVASADLVKNLSATGWAASGNPNAIDSYEAITTGAKNDIKLAEVIGVDYGDEKWDLLLDKLDVETMHNLYKTGAYSTIEIGVIDKPITHEYDGPEGLHVVHGTAELMISATWNNELAERYGKINGSIGILDNVNGWYAPGIDIHRTPFSGRNYEYFSEDAFLTGVFGAEITKGAQSKGLSVVLKHMALNDQESNRDANGAVATFCKEQAIREIYLRPFEMCVKDGNALGIMQGMNRIGYTRCRSNYNLNIGVVREEWGFKGLIITDYNIMDTEESMACISGGCNLQLYGQGNPLTETTSKGVQYMLREAAHHVLYFVANGNALNGYTADTSYNPGVANYVLILIALDIFIVAMLGLGLWLKLYGYKLKNDGCTDEKILKKNKILNIVYWAVVGAFVLAVIIIFFAWGLPLLRQAFEIS